ncbi:MAG: OmpA family protein, partial [Planctomycetes bacterium]|nr:OmpA family protein [Planctomycetota bacterium]
FSGCSNLQSENERLTKVKSHQEKIILELTDANLNLNKRCLALDKQLKEQNLSEGASQAISTLDGALENQLKTMLDSLTDALKEDGDLEVIQTKSGGTIRIPEKILFRPGEAKLSDSGLKVLDRVSHILKNYPDQTIRIDGHTDSDPIRRTAKQHSSNWDLSAKRAVSVTEHLTRKGELDSDRVYLAAFSFHRPLDPKNKTLNRRVEITILNNPN